MEFSNEFDDINVPGRFIGWSEKVLCLMKSSPRLGPPSGSIFKNPSGVIVCLYGGCSLLFGFSLPYTYFCTICIAAISSFRVFSFISNFAYISLIWSNCSTCYDLSFKRSSRYLSFSVLISRTFFSKFYTTSSFA